MKNLYLLIFMLLINLSNAQIGIGNTNPKAQLDISASSPSAPIATDGLLIPRVTTFPAPVTIDQNGMMVFLTTAFSGNKVGFYYYDFPSLTWKWMPTGNNGNIWQYNNANTRIDLPFQSDGTTARPIGNEAVILDNGNVGFGTLSPARHFQVNRDFNAGTKFAVSNPNVGINAFSQITAETIGATSYLYSINNGYVLDPLYPWFTASNSLLQGTGVGGLSLGATNPSGFMNFFTGGNDESMRITTAGNIGIGTKTPSEKLDLAGNFKFSGALMPNNIAGTIGQVIVSAGAGNAPTWNSASSITANEWHTTGNALTVNGTNFIGTTDNVPLNFKVANQKAARISSSGDTFFGYRSGDVNTAVNNTGFGAGTLGKNTTGEYNQASGNNALSKNISGNSNTANGYSALFENTTGINNTATGRNSLNDNTANNNTANGHTSLYKNTTGASNVGIGYQALYQNLVGANNTAIGTNALENNLGSRNIGIGYNAAVPDNAANNQMSIGNVIYGTTMSTTALGKIGIGVSNPSTRLQVGPDHAIPNTGGLVQINLNDADSQIQGLKVSVNKTTGLNFGVNGTAYGTGASTNIGLYGYAANATSKNWGLYIDEGDSYMKGNTGIGTLAPTEKLDVLGNIKFSGAIMPNNNAGTNGQVLVSAGAGVAPTWDSNPVKPYTTTGASTGVYNISLSEYTVRVFGGVTGIQLPTAVGNLGKTYIIIGSNALGTKTWTTLGGNIYDDVTNTSLTTITGNQRYMIQSDGNDWIVIGN